MTKHDFRFKPADHERMKATLDSLSDNPTEEEAEAVLQACGTSGKEVVNEFIERLLRENLELKQELADRAAVTAPRGDAGANVNKLLIEAVIATTSCYDATHKCDRISVHRKAVIREMSNLMDIARTEERKAATSSPTPAESVCAKCGGSGEIEIGCAMDHALTAPCVECRGTGTITTAPPERTRVEGEQKL